MLRLGWAVLFGMLCELASLAGYRVYAPYTTRPLQAAWFACVVQIILLATHVLTDWSKLGYFLFTAVIAAMSLVLKDEVRTRREDIAMLAAAATEAVSEAQQVPANLQHLCGGVTTFGARATAAAELAQAALMALE